MLAFEGSGARVLSPRGPLSISLIGGLEAPCPGDEERFPCEEQIASHHQDPGWIKRVSSVLSSERVCAPNSREE